MKPWGVSLCKTSPQTAKLHYIIANRGLRISYDGRDFRKVHCLEIDFIFIKQFCHFFTLFNLLNQKVDFILYTQRRQRRHEMDDGVFSRAEYWVKGSRRVSNMYRVFRAHTKKVRITPNHIINPHSLTHIPSLHIRQSAYITSADGKIRQSLEIPKWK